MFGRVAGVKAQILLRTQINGVQYASILGVATALLDVQASTTIRWVPLPILPTQMAIPAPLDMCPFRPFPPSTARLAPILHNPMARTMLLATIRRRCTALKLTESQITTWQAGGNAAVAKTRGIRRWYRHDVLTIITSAVLPATLIVINIGRVC